MAVLFWTVVPLALLHLVMWRLWRETFRFQLVVDLLLVVVLGPALVVGGDLNPVRVLEHDPPFSAWQFSDRTEYQPVQSDLVLQFHPWWAEARRQLADGRFPLIADRIGGGMPLAAHGQIGLWAPVMAPVWVLGPERGTTVMAWWKLELAALGVFLMLRLHWRLRWNAAALAGVVWAGGAFQVAWLLVPLSWVTASLPWFWWWTSVALGEGRRVGAVVGLGCAFGWLLGCGLHPEMAVITVGSCLMAGLILRPLRWRRLVVISALAVPVTLVLAWPTLAAIHSSAKVQQLRDEEPNRQRISSEIRNAAARQMLVPMANGHPGRGDWRAPFPHAAAATGVGGVALVLIAAGGIRRRYNRLMWAALAAVAVAGVLAYRVPPLDMLLVRIPPIDRMTLPRFAVLAPWGLALLAALSMDGLGRRLARPRVWPWLTAGGLLVVAVSSRPWQLETVDTALVAATVVVAGVVAAVGGRHRSLLLLMAAVELSLYAIGINPLAASRDRLPTPPVVKRLMELQDQEPGRVIGVHGVLRANTASRYGLVDLRAYDPVRPWPFARMMAHLGELEPTLGGPLARTPAGLCGAWSVRYLVTPKGGEASGWTRVWDHGSATIWSNPRWLPEVRLVGRVRPAVGGQGGAVPSDDDMDYSAEAVVSGETSPVGADRVHLSGLELDSSSVRAVTDCDGPCLVVVARPWAPGWRARVDGSSAPVVRTNLAGLGVVSPAGRHTVELNYQPWSW